MYLHAAKTKQRSSHDGKKLVGSIPSHQQNEIHRSLETESTPVKARIQLVRKVCTFVHFLARFAYRFWWPRIACGDIRVEWICVSLFLDSVGNSLTVKLEMWQASIHRYHGGKRTNSYRIRPRFYRVHRFNTRLSI